MHGILYICPNDADAIAEAAALALAGKRFEVCRMSIERVADTVGTLCSVFAGRPPEILVADLTRSASGLPIRHVMHLVRLAWGDDVPQPIRIAILASAHLADSAWFAEADDFVIAPFEPRELLTRIELLLFRKRHTEALDLLNLEDARIELSGGRVFGPSDVQIGLTPREFELLRFLATQRGKFFARDRLLDLVWELDFDGGERTVDIHVRRLRAKLPPRAEAILETRRGVGYGFTAASAATSL